MQNLFEMSQLFFFFVCSREYICEYNCEVLVFAGLCRLEEKIMYANCLWLDWLKPELDEMPLSSPASEVSLQYETLSFSAEGGEKA